MSKFYTYIGFLVLEFAWFASTAWLRWEDGSAALLPNTFEDLCSSVMAPRAWERKLSDNGFSLDLVWKDIDADWEGGLRARMLSPTLHYSATSTHAPADVTLMSIRHSLWDGGSQVHFYGEGFQMLSQTAGTLREQHDVGMFSDQVGAPIDQPP